MSGDGDACSFSRDHHAVLEEGSGTTWARTSLEQQRNVRRHVRHIGTLHGADALDAHVECESF